MIPSAKRGIADRRRSFIRDTPGEIVGVDGKPAALAQADDGSATLTAGSWWNRQKGCAVAGGSMVA